VPAYKRFLLPMQILKGYRHGFVVQRVGERGHEELYHAAAVVAKTLTKRLAAITEHDHEKLHKVNKVVQKLQNTVVKYSGSANGHAVEASRHGHSAVGNGAPEGYAPLPASQAEELEKLRREVEELGTVRTENMRLSKENQTFKETFRESIKVLKSLQQTEEERAEGLRQHNLQMDHVLGRVRGLESRLCLSGPYRPPGS